jgi:hypothetical protein
MEAKSYREVRASFTSETIRVYQAYSDEIAMRAIKAQRFESPFKRHRMTWIKPSFSWMMYRAGWAMKEGQERVLAVDLRRDGFEWALANSSPSSFDPSVHSTMEHWRADLARSPVRVQWDPERTLTLESLPQRTIQIGLSGPAVDAYVDQWTVKIADVTELARKIEGLIARHDLEAAEAIRPLETPYPLAPSLAKRIGCTGKPPG